MMDVSSMYGNHHHHHHHSNNFHNAGNNVDTVATAAAVARNGYSNAYFPVGGSPIGHVQHTQSPYTQHVHPLTYGSSYNSNSAQYYQQQQTVQQLQQQPQQKQHATPPLVSQLSMSAEQQTQQQQHHSHLFSPSAAEYGIVSTTGNTPHHVSSHSPSESYYESDSMHSYYATAAVATVPSSTNSPIATQSSSTPNIPPIISSENGLSYTNLDCLYNQNPHAQSQLQQQYDYGTLPVNCNNSEEKYANVLNANFGGGPSMLIDESALSIENSKQQASNHIWHHHHHQHHLSGGYTLQDPNLTIDSINIESHVHNNITNMQQNSQSSSMLPLTLCDEATASHHSSNCMASRSQQVISPDGSTSQSNAQSKSPNHASNLPTYKWMQLKRNVPKPQRK